MQHLFGCLCDFSAVSGSDSFCSIQGTLSSISCQRCLHSLTARAQAGIILLLRDQFLRWYWTACGGMCWSPRPARKQPSIANLGTWLLRVLGTVPFITGLSALMWASAGQGCMGGGGWTSLRHVRRLQLWAEHLAKKAWLPSAWLRVNLLTARTWTLAPTQTSCKNDL